MNIKLFIKSVAYILGNLIFYLDFWFFFHFLKKKREKFRKF